MKTVVMLLQLLLLLLHQVTTLVDLFPFNNVKCYTLKERLVECAVNGLVMALPLAGYFWSIDWLCTAALVIYPLLLLGEYLSWWHPYFFGPSAAWQKTYDRLFRPTLVVLPPIGNHPIPNLEHLLLHAITLITTVVTYIYAFRS